MIPPFPGLPFVWWLPSGRSSDPASAPSGKNVAFAGIFQTIQCNMSSTPLPGRGSISWTISANVHMVLAFGAPVQRSGGETAFCPAEQVYFAGNGALSAKPGLISRNGAGGAAPPRCPPWPAGRAAGGAFCWARETRAPKTRIAAITSTHLPDKVRMCRPPKEDSGLHMVRRSGWQNKELLWCAIWRFLMLAPLPQWQTLLLSLFGCTLPPTIGLVG
jgi:hypothetical protein